MPLCRSGHSETRKESDDSDGSSGFWSGDGPCRERYNLPDCLSLNSSALLVKLSVCPSSSKPISLVCVSYVWTPELQRKPPVRKIGTASLIHDPPRLSDRGWGLVYGLSQTPSLVTYRSTHPPSTKTITHGKTWTPNFVIRKGVSATDVRRKSV